MAITYQSAGAIAYSSSGGSSVAPAFPASIVPGDLLVLIVGMKPSTANGGDVTTPSRWRRLGQLTGAGGYASTLGADTGNTDLFVFTKRAYGDETGNLSVSLSGNNVSWAIIQRLTCSTLMWSLGVAFGSDITAGNVSIAFDKDPGVKAADYILGAMCIPTDVTTPSQFSAEALSQSGITFGTVTEVGEPDTTVGNQIGGFLIRAAVSSGTSTGGVPTMTATAGGTTTNVRGPGVFIRIREEARPTVSQANYDYIFYSGSVYIPSEQQDVNIVAYFGSNDNPAAVTLQYGSGKVFLESFHSEILSDGGYTSTDTTRAFWDRWVSWALSGSNSGLPVAVFNDTGIWSPSYDAICAYLTGKGISYVTVDGATLNANDMRGTYRALIIPGGTTVTTVDANGVQHVKDFVSAGNPYVGTCLGSAAASYAQSYDGTMYYSMGLFDGCVVGVTTSEQLRTVYWVDPPSGEPPMICDGASQFNRMLVEV